MKNNEIIDDEKIRQTCQNGVLKYIENQETLKIEGINILVAHKFGVKNFFIKPRYDLAQVLNLILRNEVAEISFDIKCQIFEDLRNGNARNINIRAYGVKGILKKEEELNFEIEFVHFSKDLI